MYDGNIVLVGNGIVASLVSVEAFVGGIFVAATPGTRQKLKYPAWFCGRGVCRIVCRSVLFCRSILCVWCLVCARRRARYFFYFLLLFGFVATPHPIYHPTSHIITTREDDRFVGRRKRTRLFAAVFRFRFLAIPLCCIT